MPNLIVVKHKNQDCYIIDCVLVKDGQRTMRVNFQGKQMFLPKAHCDFIAPGRCAIKVELYDMLFNQDVFKKTTMVKATFARNMGHVPRPRIRRIGKN